MCQIEGKRIKSLHVAITNGKIVNAIQKEAHAQTDNQVPRDLRSEIPARMFFTAAVGGTSRSIELKDTKVSNLCDEKTIRGLEGERR